MAKTTTRKSPAKAKSKSKSQPKKPNLFARASNKKPDEPKKKKKGTVLELPNAPMDNDGKLTGESARLHLAITALLEAAKEEKAAKNKAGACKGTLKPWAETQWVELMSKLGVLPDTPITVVNHKGESVTFIVTDKSKQYDLDDDQVNALIEIMGEEGISKVVVDRTVFSFDPTIMSETAANGEESVTDVVAELVSEAIHGTDRLTDEQKESLLSAESKTWLRPDVVQRIPELVGQDPGRIGRFLAACGSAVTRYIKS